MAEEIREGKRSQVGFGSSYDRGNARAMGPESPIHAVLGGQLWRVKPDKEAKAVNPCLWMKAGVVAFKDCNNFYDCTTCKYDMGMSKKAEKGKQISWQDAMRKRSDMDRVCRHSLTERIEKRICAYDYKCSTCDFDQFFEDVWTPKTGSIPHEMEEVKGFKIPKGYYFHNGHAWAKIESGGYVRVGMDDFALKLFGKADAFDLPLIGKELDKDKAGWGMKCKDNTADVLSPVGGVIVEVNSQVRDNPAFVNEKGYEEGWLFMLRTPHIRDSFKLLMDDRESIDWIDTEVGKLENMIEEVAGPLAADGGHLKENIYERLPGLGWKNLTRTFLKT
ncbi:MAG: glycine cleavage system protein H [Desulfatiglans sp.]|jgi:glycine cleavage system H lipoate-binding protein|nr:glycine cleavage system protein H [Thermodesulfobacteriota bacterium]MEE4353500.1 glycine cleavage system protein H [Desulfatiglans sp.]